MGITKTGAGVLAWRVLIILIAGFLAWRIVVSGLADHALEQLRKGDKAAAQRVLGLMPGQPDALYQEAMAQRLTDGAGAEVQLVQAYRQNPTRALSLIHI